MCKHGIKPTESNRIIAEHCKWIFGLISNTSKHSSLKTCDSISKKHNRTRLNEEKTSL